MEIIRNWRFSSLGSSRKNTINNTHKKEKKDTSATIITIISSSCTPATTADIGLGWRMLKVKLVTYFQDIDRPVMTLPTLGCARTTPSMEY